MDRLRGTGRTERMLRNAVALSPARVVVVGKNHEHCRQLKLVASGFGDVSHIYFFSVNEHCLGVNPRRIFVDHYVIESDPLRAWLREQKLLEVVGERS